MQRKTSLHLFFVLLLLATGILGGCGSKRKSSGYTIGVDPTWYPIQTGGQDKNILAFSIDLLVNIAKKEKLELAVVQMSWDNLLWGLREKRYDAALSALRPYAFYLKEYSFSLLYLETGPVLVLPKASKYKNLKQMKGKKIGVVRGSSAALLMQMTPGILLQAYPSIPETLHALNQAEIDGAAVEVLIAQKFIQDLYANTFKIINGPITTEGIRLITLYNQASELIEKFDKGLAKLKKTGEYENLLKKWGLSPDGQQTAHLHKDAESFLQYYF